MNLLFYSNLLLKILFRENPEGTKEKKIKKGTNTLQIGRKLVNALVKTKQKTNKSKSWLYILKIE